MRIHHAVGELRLDKKNYMRILGLLEAEMKDSNYEMVVTECEDYYYISIITGHKCQCKADGNNVTGNQLLGAIANVAARNIMEDELAFNYIKEAVGEQDMDETAVISKLSGVFNATIHHISSINAEFERAKRAQAQMMEIVKFIANTPLLLEMYKNFITTDEQKQKLNEGKVDADHVASVAHLVFDRTISSLIDSAKLESAQIGYVEGDLTTSGVTPSVLAAKEASDASFNTIMAGLKKGLTDRGIPLPGEEKKEVPSDEGSPSEETE